jgi:hypothetical protein
MAVYYSADNIVDRLDDDFDAEGWTTEQLRAEEERLAEDIDELEILISDLIDRRRDIEMRACDVDDALEEREEVEEKEEIRRGDGMSPFAPAHKIVSAKANNSRRSRVRCCIN